MVLTPPHQQAQGAHLISMSLSWENSQCFLFSTSIKPHLVCRPNSFFPPTETSRSLPITVKGIRFCKVKGLKHSPYPPPPPPPYHYFCLHRIFILIRCISSWVYVDSIVTDVLTDLQGNIRNYVNNGHGAWSDHTPWAWSGHTHPQFECFSLFQCQGIRLGNNWYYVYTVVQSLHKLYVDGP